MRKFIVVTDKDGYRIALNVDNITKIFESGNGLTCILSVGDNYNSGVYAKEKIDEIIAGL